MTPAQQSKIATLMQEIAHLERELNGEDPDAIVKRHTELLHLYNERKAATRVMIAKIAAMKQTTVREVQEQLGINAED